MVETFFLFLKPLLCCFVCVQTCTAQRSAGKLGYLASFFIELTYFCLSSRALLKFSFIYRYYFWTVCVTGASLEQNREIIKRNKSGILSILWPEVPPFPIPVAWKMWFLTGSLLEFWLLTSQAMLSVMRAQYHEMTGWGGGWKKQQRSRNFPPYSLDYKVSFSPPFGCKEWFLWVFYLSMVPWPQLYWVPGFGSQVQEKRGKRRKHTSLWVAS